MKINTEGLALIKRFEGLQTEAYLCPAGVWTIGYGHTATVKPGQRITQAQAEELLVQDVAKFEAGVAKLVKVKLNANQFSALVSFAFNIGLSALEDSTLLARLNDGDYNGAAKEFSRWVYAGSDVLSGLVNRRAAERTLFTTPMEPQANLNPGPVWRLICPADNWQNPIEMRDGDFPLLREVGKRLNLPCSIDHATRKVYLGKPNADKHTDKPQPLPLAQRIRPQLQSNSKSCGQSSVAMCIEVLTGEKWSDLDVAARYGYSLLACLQAECPKHEWADAGNFTRSMWPQIEQRLKDGLPVIMGLNGPDFSPSGYGHIVVLVGVSGSKVTLADPAHGKLRTVDYALIQNCPPHTDGKFVFLCTKK